MIRIVQENNKIAVRGETGDLAPKHESQLAFWGFNFDPVARSFVSICSDKNELVPKLVGSVQNISHISLSS